MADETPASSPPAAQQEMEAAEAAVAAAAITLESVQAAIETESDNAEDRQEELLKEVRACRTKLEALSGLMERGPSESPSLQTLLIEVGQIQKSLQAVQNDLALLTAEESEDGEGREAAKGANTAAEPVSARSISPSSEKAEDGGQSSSGREGRSNPPRSSPSPTPPKKRHYVKI